MIKVRAKPLVEQSACVTAVTYFIDSMFSLGKSSIFKNTTVFAVNFSLLL